MSKKPARSANRAQDAPAPAEAAPSRTVYVDGRPALVLFVLPRLAGRPLAVRVTHEPPCRLCEAPLTWDRAGWRCPECDDTPTAEHLANWCREHVRDGVRAGYARRERGRRAWQVARAAHPGTAALLLAAAAAGGSPSRAYLLGDVTGAERRALAWVLRDAGDRPLTAEQCLAAADELASLTRSSIGDGGSLTP